MHSRRAVCVATVALLFLFGSGPLAGPAPQDDNRRELTVRARAEGFEPARIEVRLNDIVALTFSADDGPHLFAIDAYRIAKRATPGVPVRFEFRADQAGTFPYYCTLTAPDGQAHDIRGELAVRK
jgi:heme/copper-type cytochrome/quinol oxidase subunit 2